MRIVIPALAAAALLAAGCERPAPAPDSDPRAAATVLPAVFETDLVVVRPVTEAGDTLVLFTDTGGGLLLLRDAVERLGLEVDSAGTASLPPFRAGEGVPEPRGSAGGRLFVLDEPGPLLEEYDGMLGQAWFADRVWTIDYPGQRLLLWPDSVQPPPGDAEHRVPLGFRADSTGRRSLSFPRLRVEIDGDSLDLLFDTGATVRLTAGALVRLGNRGPPERATSFITTSVLAGWLERHPDWTVLEDADESVPDMRMVEVPEISVAGYRVGPVWFTERPDPNFHEYMSGFMDRRVDGALGGSALRWFRVTVDYPGAVAAFTRPGA